MCLLMVFFGVSLIFIEPYQAAFGCFTESTICCSLWLCSDKLHSTKLLLSVSLSLQAFPQRPACCTGPAASAELVHSFSLLSYNSGRARECAVVTE